MERPAQPVGSSIPRVDGVAKVTGRARYLDDLDAPGAWYGATVRSKVAHGVLEAIDLDPAFDWSQVVGRDRGGYPGHATCIALIEDDQVALVPIGGRGDARRRGDRARRRADEGARVRGGDGREAAREARCRPCSRSRTRSRVKQKLYGDDNVFKQFLIRKGHASDARARGRDRGRRARDRGHVLHVAAGADVHRAAGDDGRVGATAAATSSARCSARTTCTRR